LRAKIASAVERSGGEQSSVLGGPKQRTVLALLLQNANELVARERLVAAVWGEDAPPESAARVRAHISRLRKLLAAEAGGRAIIETGRDGYVLYADEETLRALADRIEFRLRPAWPSGRLAVRPRAGRRVLALATIAVVALATAVAAGSGGPSTSSSLDGNSVVAIDLHTGSLLGEVPLGGRPGGLAVGNGTVWVGNRADKALVRVAAVQRRVVEMIPLDVDPISVAVGGGIVWVLGGDGTIVMVDPMTSRVVATITAAASGRVCCPHDVAFAHGAVWVAQGGAVTRIDAGTRRVERTGFRNVRSIASSGRTLWGVLGTRFERVRQLKPLGDAVRVVKDVDTIDKLASVVAGQGGVWTTSAKGTLRRISPRTGRVIKSVPLNRPIADAAVSRGGVVWVALDDG
jgi:Transcriptional regulatory protein, C terminal